MEKALALLRQNAQQQQRNNQQNMVTPGGTQRPMHPQFPLGGQAAQNVSNNLHIPVGRHRSINNGQQNGPGTPQSNGAGSAASPMRMPHMALASNGSNAGTPPAGNPQNQLVRNMINQGIPTVPNRGNMNMQQQMTAA
jgi:hypothetical protein